MYTWEFMREVFRENRYTGAIAPSNPALAEAVTDMAEIGDAGVVVEYGPGTGVFTEAILHKIRPDAYFIGLEINQHFVDVLNKRFPEHKFYCDGAENTIKYLKEAGHDGCDAIVSGLPWTRFDEDMQDSILNATWDVLRPGGRFVTFAYAFSPLVPSGRRFFKGKLPEKFPGVKRSKPIWKNIPPCHVYIAEKPAEQ